MNLETIKTISESKVVVLDLFANWCTPCKTLGPILDEALPNHDFIFLKINVDENVPLSKELSVQSIPTVLALKGGEVIDRFIGSQSKSFVESWLKGLDDV